MPYGNQSVTTGSHHAVRRVNTPYDMGALDARDLLVMRGRLGAVRTMQQTTHCEAPPVMPHGISPATYRYPNMQSLNRVAAQGSCRSPFSPGAADLRALLVIRGRLGQPLPPLGSSRYPHRAGVARKTYGPIAGRYVVNGGRRLGQVAEIATAATSLAPAIEGISQLFGPAASGAYAERQAKVYTYYEQALTAPGSVSSEDAVITLAAISTNGFDAAQNIQQNNPQITRAYAQQALQRLSSQGWINVNTSSPKYTGIGASGVVYAPTGTSGLNTEAAVSQGALPSGNTAALSQGYAPSYGAGVAISPLLLLGALGLGAVLILRNR